MQFHRQMMLLFALTVLPTLVSGDDVRGGWRSVIVESASLADLKKNILDLAKGGGGEARMTEENLLYIEDQMRLIFDGLPKNIHGNIEHAAVSYALHRFFVRTHGLYLKGLEPQGRAWNMSSPTALLEKHLPSYIQHLFEKKLREGFDYHQLAVLAATLEHIVHVEEVQRLKVAYDSHSFAQEVPLDERQAANVVETYMTLFILGKQSERLTPEEFEQNRMEIATKYPNWNATVAWLHKVRHEVVAQRSGGAKMSFELAGYVVEEVRRQYGATQNGKCRGLKNALVKMEDKGSGRVKIQDFYRGSLQGAWQFTEKTEYLRQLGALDESDSQQLRVFIPNYINSLPQCALSSSFFSVCCVNQCESLMGHIERRVAAPNASTTQIIKIVQSLASSTIEAPRTLSPRLLERLDEIAVYHDGSVPLHGRLFAQWMHHAFPRECPYPHLSGTTRPQAPDEWMQESGSSAQVSQTEILAQYGVGDDDSPEEDVYCEVDSLPGLESPWSPVEELWANMASLEVHPEAVKRSFRATLSYFMLFLAVVAMALNVKQNIQDTRNAYRGTSSLKHVDRKA